MCVEDETKRLCRSNDLDLDLIRYRVDLSRQTGDRWDGTYP